MLAASWLGLIMLLWGCVRTEQLVVADDACESSTVSIVATHPSAAVSGLVPWGDGFALLYVDERRLWLQRLDRSGTADGPRRDLGTGAQFDELIVRESGPDLVAVFRRLVDGRPQLFAADLRSGDTGPAEVFQLTAEPGASGNPVLAVRGTEAWVGWRERSTLLVGMRDGAGLNPAITAMTNDESVEALAMGHAFAAPGGVTLLARDGEALVWYGDAGRSGEPSDRVEVGPALLGSRRTLATLSPGAGRAVVWYDGSALQSALVDGEGLPLDEASGQAIEGSVGDLAVSATASRVDLAWTEESGRAFVRLAEAPPRSIAAAEARRVRLVSLAGGALAALEVADRVELHRLCDVD